MEITGKIIAVLPARSGVSARTGSEWKVQEYVLETQEQYPRKVCFQVSGNRIEQYPVSVGDEVVVSFDLESREAKGRWYTDVRAWTIERVQSAAPAGSPVPPPPVDFAPAEPADDLPF